MNDINEYFKIPAKPIARKESVVIGPNVKFSVLTSRIIRFEYSKMDEFEDNPSQKFWYRYQPQVEFTVKSDKEKIEIQTEFLKLIYIINKNGFTKENLSIELLKENKVWHYGDEPEGNLNGTARTLDGIEGAVGLNLGLLSRDGWSVIDDSKTVIFDESGWVGVREHPENDDIYFFGYGHDYESCLKDYFKIAGKVPMISRWTLGNWWSKYWAYTDEELLDLMDDFKKQGIPMAVCVVDMDWHLVENKYHKGWTGYTWNKELFPEPEKFLDELHKKGLKTAFNLHPADGIAPHEEVYEKYAEFMGIDPETKKIINFDITDSRYIKAYFELLHHPLEKQGVDFWWMDWQQEKDSKIPALDPLWWLNHLHYLDLMRDESKRGMIFSRWGGLGNQRYPIGFSGDTIVSWDSLAFQVYFTSIASNVGCFWWSHDIGGHMGGCEDTELYTRWIQFGVFSPIMRLHSAKNPFQDRKPWAYDAETLRITKDYMQLRHRFIPYIYSMNAKCEFEGQALVRPMYYLNPECEEAYSVPYQYYFGSELIIAPYVVSQDSETGLSRQVVWLPEGAWFDFFTGEYYQGGKMNALYGKLDEMPVFAKAGAIIPLGEKKEWGGIDNPKVFDINIFPGKDNVFRLYEDDGETLDYQKGCYALTEFKEEWMDNCLEFKIKKPEGNLNVIPSVRKYNLLFFGIKNPGTVSVQINGKEINTDYSYDNQREIFKINELILNSNEEFCVKLSVAEGGIISKRDRKKEKFYKMIDSFNINNPIKLGLFKEMDNILKDITKINRFRVDLGKNNIKALIEVFAETGAYEITNTSKKEKLIALWNNNQNESVKYNLSYSYWGEYNGENGIVPKFKIIKPEEKWYRYCVDVGFKDLYLQRISIDVKNTK